MAEMSALERELRRRCRDDYKFFARKNLKIRPKGGGTLLPLKFNAAQQFLHSKAQTQLKQTGMVRIICCKGRQQGVSTYIEGRFYHQTSHRKGVKAFILTHRDDATENLFEMVERFHKNNNPLLRPQTSHANSKELKFDVLDSGYGVGTAGSASGIGRSDTIQLFHASEAAFWKNGADIMAGLGQTVHRLPGTEIFLESTAQGMGGFFHEEWQKAAAGLSDYIPVFIPWFWEPSYSIAIPEGTDIEWTREEMLYGEAYELTPEQMLWKRVKAREMQKPGSGERSTHFDQEYPATPEIAFQASGEGAYINPIAVARARKARVTPPSFVPIVLGVDPARGGGDGTGIIDRQGRKAGGHICERWDIPDLMTTTGKIVKVIQTLRPIRVFIDVTGLGAGIYDRLCELNWGHIVHPVNFSSEADEPDKFFNRRAEMWAAMQEWFTGTVPVQIPERDDLHQDVTAPIWGKGKTRFMSNGSLIIEPKESILERLKRSPDMGDALALTFAVPTGTYANTIPKAIASAAGGDPKAGY